MDANKLFNEALPAALVAQGDKAKSVNAKFQFNIAGAGEWHLDLTATGPTCVPGTSKSDVVINISNDNFTALAKNPQANAMGMFLTGKLKVQGNQALAMKLKDIFGYVKA
jgi:putative sterol carrier protein